MYALYFRMAHGLSYFWNLERISEAIGTNTKKLGSNEWKCCEGGLGTKITFIDICIEGVSKIYWTSYNTRQA